MGSAVCRVLVLSRCVSNERMSGQVEVGHWSSNSTRLTTLGRQKSPIKGSEPSISPQWWRAKLGQSSEPAPQALPHQWTAWLLAQPCLPVYLPPLLRLRSQLVP